MFKIFKEFARQIWGNSWARKYHKNELKNYYHPERSFKYLTGYSNEIASDDLSYKPIFIFSAGWRSGSTMLQRLICSNSDLLIWGEPYDKSCLIQKLAETFLPLNESWPPESYFIKYTHTENIADLWIANLYPNLTDFLKAHQKIFINLFAQTAISAGFNRWGIKEVRFGLKEALYLKVLFPYAKFIFLERELLPAYTSYVVFSKQKHWYSRWPNNQVFSPYTFAKHRAVLIREFHKASELVGGITIKYEDIVSGDFDLEKLEEYIEAKIDSKILTKKVGSSKSKKSNYRPTWFELFLLSMGNKHPG